MCTCEFAANSLADTLEFATISCPMATAIGRFASLLYHQIRQRVVCSTIQIVILNETRHSDHEQNERTVMSYQYLLHRGLGVCLDGKIKILEVSYQMFDYYLEVLNID